MAENAAVSTSFHALGFAVEYDARPGRTADLCCAQPGESQVRAFSTPARQILSGRLSSSAFCTWWLAGQQHARRRSCRAGTACEQLCRESHRWRACRPAPFATARRGSFRLGRVAACGMSSLLAGRCGDALTESPAFFFGVRRTFLRALSGPEICLGLMPRPSFPENGCCSARQ